MQNEAVKLSMGRITYHAFLNRRRAAVETARRAMLQFREARALLTGSDSTERERYELDHIIDVLTRLLPRE